MPTERIFKGLRQRCTRKKDGKQSDISGLSVGDVLLVMDAAPYGSEKKSVFYLRKQQKISGTVTGIWDDKAVIDKTEYETHRYR